MMLQNPSTCTLPSATPAIRAAVPLGAPYAYPLVWLANRARCRAVGLTLAVVVATVPYPACACNPGGLVGPGPVLAAWCKASAPRAGTTTPATRLA